MILLVFFAFLAGIVTILSPCILPILPIVLSGSLTGGKRRPLGVVTGFILSFTFFTLFLSAIVKATGISADALRTVAVVMIASFGLSLIIPKFRVWMEKLFSQLSGLLPQQSQRDGFMGGILVGFTLGLIWAPCVGPILASIISLALTGTVTGSAVVITVAYSVGTAIPMLAITYGGRTLLTRIPWLTRNTLAIQKIFGVLMIVTAIAIYFSWDRQFQAYILEKFPNYGVGLTKLEDNDLVKNELKKMKEQPNLDSAPNLITGGQWFNGQSVTLLELRGKVVLMDFWTYTCINCIRTLPYLKNWHAKYKDKGLIIIGVHTPEFEFEKNPDNVAKAIKDFDLEYLVMQDNDFATWNAYDNRYWPAKYLIDKNGKIRYTHFGEGDYDETEKKIQELLALDMPIDNPEYQVHARTPETYLGTARGGFAPAYTLGGSWTKSEEYAMPATGATLTFPFDAADVFLVMRPKDKPGKVEVYLDGKLVNTITVDTDRLYDLIKLPTPGQHILLLKFLDPNLELYAFTFG